MTGIILKTKTKAELTLDEVTQGAMGKTTDSNELVINEIGDLKYRKIKINSTDAVSKNSGIPSGGQDGDLVLNSYLGENIDYFKLINWTPRYEGYDEEYLLRNFEPRVNPPTPDDYVKIDGSTPMTNGYDDSTDDSVVTKGFIDILAATLTGDDIIKTDGSVQMIPSYSPILENDVINYAYLSSGEILIIPPTVDPIVVGQIWNDNGVPKISDGIMYLWEANGNPYRFQMDPLNGKMLMSLYQATYADILNPDGTIFGQLTGGTSWTISNNPRQRSIYGDFALVQKNNDTFDLYNISTSAGRQTPIKSITSTLPGADSFGVYVDMCSTGIIIGDERGNIEGTGEASIFNMNGEFEFSLVSPHLNDGSDGTYPGYFSTSVSISENYIVVGEIAPYEVATDSSSGQAHLFQRNGTLIKTLKNPSPPDAGWFDYFGSGVMISEPNNMIVVVGHQCGDDHQGSAFLFDLTGTLIKELVIVDRSTLDGDLGWYGYNAHINDTTGIISLGTGSEEIILFDKNGDLIVHIKNDIGYYGSSIGTFEDKLYVGALNYTIDAQHDGPILVTKLP